MELLLLISYFVHWMHYPNTATNCAFDMHRQEGGREAGRQREKGRGRGSEGEREELFFCQGLFQPAHATMLRSFAESNLCASQSCARYSNFLQSDFCIIYFKDKNILSCM